MASEGHPAAPLAEKTAETGLSRVTSGETEQQKAGPGSAEKKRDSTGGRWPSACCRDQQEEAWEDVASVMAVLVEDGVWGRGDNGLVGREGTGGRGTPPEVSQGRVGPALGQLLPVPAPRATRLPRAQGKAVPLV